MSASLSNHKQMYLWAYFAEGGESLAVDAYEQSLDCLGTIVSENQEANQDRTEPSPDGSGVPAKEPGQPHSAVGSTLITVPTRSIVLSKDATRRIPVLSAQATR